MLARVLVPGWLLIFLINLYVPAAAAGEPLWSWVKGSSQPNHPAAYGRQGVPDPANTPGARMYAMSWADAAGRLWLFGGIDYHGSFLNDLWRFDPATGNWAWVKGNDIPNQPGVYGQQGVPDPANTPGARWGAATWVDRTGRLWLFGGDGLAASGNGTMAMNDLWCFDPATGNWTWVKGSDTFSQPGNYGALGVEAPTNVPGARYGAACWRDPAGRFWLFGGHGNDGSGILYYGYLNDLWRFDPATGNWTWVKGSKSMDAAGSYGSQGVEAVANTPGGRAFAAAWTGKEGQLWLFEGYDGSRMWNNLWRFNPATGNWAWMKGSDKPNQVSIPGTPGIPDQANTPGSREKGLSWTDSAGRFWLFIGVSRSIGDGYPGHLNDLWRYDPATNCWTWVRGSLAQDPPEEVYGIYGRQGVPASANTPGSRVISVGWTDPAGRFWLFGGYGLGAAGAAGDLDDLWCLAQPNAAAPAAWGRLE
jgi:N-acetylneuraminic acid mutarotase